MGNLRQKLVARRLQPRRARLGARVVQHLPHVGLVVNEPGLAPRQREEDVNHRADRRAWFYISRLVGRGGIRGVGLRWKRGVIPGVCSWKLRAVHCAWNGPGVARGYVYKCAQGGGGGRGNEPVADFQRPARRLDVAAAAVWARVWPED